MKNKKAILCAVLAMLLVSLGIVFLCRENASNVIVNEQPTSSVVDDTDDENADVDEQDDNDEADSEEDDSDTGIITKIKNMISNIGKKGDKTDEKDDTNNVKYENEGKDEAKETLPPKTIEKFPYKIPNSQLEILTVSDYNGVYLEDGSNTNVSGVAAMIVKNTGDKPIEYASISLTDNGKELVFNGSDIPAGETIVIQEKNKTKFNKGELTDCSADVAYTDSLSKSSKDVKVTENKNNTISVKNTSGSTIPCVRVFYKYYYDEENAYVGGITYVAKVTDLGAGSETTVSPSNYASGYSKVVMVRTYDSES